MKIIDAIKKMFKRQDHEFLYIDGSLTFSQEKDSCDPSKKEMQSLRASLENAGGGYFWRIQTNGWALEPSDKRVERCLAGVLKQANRIAFWS